MGYRIEEAFNVSGVDNPTVISPGARIIFFILYGAGILTLKELIDAANVYPGTFKDQYELQDALMELLNKNIAEECYKDSELEYVLSCMVSNNSGVGQYPLTPFLDYSILLPPEKEDGSYTEVRLRDLFNGITGRNI